MTTFDLTLLTNGWDSSDIGEVREKLKAARKRGEFPADQTLLHVRRFKRTGKFYTSELYQVSKVLLDEEPFNVGHLIRYYIKSGQFGREFVYVAQLVESYVPHLVNN